MIGPQLDGVGGRGDLRLLEDILDSNRNVDGNFRQTVIITKDGQTLAGLVRRTEGKVLILADQTGKEIQIKLDSIEQRRLTTLSPMPSNFGDLLKEQQMRDLLSYLLQQKAPPPKAR